MIHIRYIKRTVTAVLMSLCMLLCQGAMTEEDEVMKQISQMTLREKVGRKR